STGSDAPTAPSPDETAAAAALTVPSAPPPRERPAPPAPPPPRRQVVRAGAPPGARGYPGAGELGASRVGGGLEEGEQGGRRGGKTGYESTQVVLDGSQAKLSVALQKKAPTPSRPPAAPKRPSSSEIVNPWE